jgi:hypothetical protein
VRTRARFRGIDEAAGVDEYRILDAARCGKVGIPQARPCFG